MIPVFGAFALLASAIVTNKVLLYAFSPEFLVAIRMLAASLFLVGYSWIKTHHKVSYDLVSRYFVELLTIACFTTFFPSNLKAYALANMPSSKMAFFGTLDPFVAALFSYVLYNERLSWQKWIGLAIGALGMCVLFLSSSPLEESLKAFGVLSYPELAAFFAIVLSRFGWIQAQVLLKRGVLGPVQLNSITMALGGFFSLVAALWTQQTAIRSLQTAPVELVHMFPFSLMSSSVQLGTFLCYTILMGNVFGLTLYAEVLKHYSATFIALAGFSIPLMVHFLGTLLLGEPFSLSFLTACAITFIGLLIFFSGEKTSNIKSLQ